MGLLTSVFGRAGTFPPDVRQRLDADGVLLLRERVGGSITYRNYRAPGRFSNLRKVGMVWAIALTSRQLLVMCNGRPMIDVPWADPRAAALAVSADPRGKLLIAFDPQLFDERTSGRVEVRAKLEDAAAAVQLVRQHQHPG